MTAAETLLNFSKINRQTGRTSRMVEAAVAAAKKDGYVFIIVATVELLGRVGRMIADIAPIERVVGEGTKICLEGGGQIGIHLSNDPRFNKYSAAMRGCCQKVFVDHSVFEPLAADLHNLAQQWDRWTKPDRPGIRQSRHDPPNEDRGHFTFATPEDKLLAAGKGMSAALEAHLGTCVIANCAGCKKDNSAISRWVCAASSFRWSKSDRPAAFDAKAAPPAMPTAEETNSRAIKAAKHLIDAAKREAYAEITAWLRWHGKGTENEHALDRAAHMIECGGCDEDIQHSLHRELHAVREAARRAERERVVECLTRTMPCRDGNEPPDAD